jgi:hypothetical protein
MFALGMAAGGQRHLLHGAMTIEAASLTVHLLGRKDPYTGIGVTATHVANVANAGAAVATGAEDGDGDAMTVALKGPVTLRMTTANIALSFAQADGAYA